MEITPCKKCGECCRTMTIPINLLDIEQISKHLKIPPEEFIKEYLELKTTDDGERTYVLRDRPCPFLEGNICGIQDIKPTTCKTTPCTRSEDNQAFRNRYGLMTMIFLECEKDDIIKHFLNTEITDDYLKEHKRYKEKTAGKYITRLNKNMDDKRQTITLLNNIIIISVHPAYRKTIMEKIYGLENQ